MAYKVSELNTFNRMSFTKEPLKWHIISSNGERLYRPHDSVVADKGGARNKVMALMMLGGGCEGGKNPRDKWMFQRVSGNNDKWYIISHNGEALYRPGDD